MLTPATIKGYIAMAQRLGREAAFAQRTMRSLPTPAAIEHRRREVERLNTLRAACFAAVQGCEVSARAVEAWRTDTGAN